MGFGSYDESEQEQPGDNDQEDEGEAVNVHEKDYDGEMSVDSDASTDELIDQLGEIKDDEAEQAEADSS